MHAIAGTAPDPAFGVQPETVESANGAVPKVPPVVERAIISNIEYTHMFHWFDAGVRHIEQLLVWREGYAVRPHEIAGRDLALSGLWIDTIDVASADLAFCIEPLVV